MTDVAGIEDPQTESGRTAIVVGAGMAGLVAARELALAGVSVTLFEASDNVGGAVASHEVGGLVLDAGAESFATKSSAFTDLADLLGLGEQIIAPHPAGAWVHFMDSKNRQKSAPLPKGATMGIPSDLNDPALAVILGRRGIIRAKLDENLPKGVGAKSKTLADLVRARMGQRVIDRLVTPIVGGVYSASVAELDPEVVLPGIRSALAEHGSLSAAIASLRRPAVKAGSAVGGLRGGIFQIAQAVRTDLTQQGADLRLNTRVLSIAPTADGGWTVHTESTKTESAGIASRDAEPARPAATKASPVAPKKAGAKKVTAQSESSEFSADLVVVATEATTAIDLVGLLAPSAQKLGDIEGAKLTLVTIVVDVPELDAAPRGTGVLVSPLVKDVKAKALTHSTVKWEWLAEEEGPGTHVIRLSYVEGALPEEEEAVIATALSDASTLLDRVISQDDVIDWDQRTWQTAATSLVTGRKEMIKEFRMELSKIPTLATTGAWLAGNGLVSVIADAQKRARGLL